MGNLCCPPEVEKGPSTQETEHSGIKPGASQSAPARPGPAQAAEGATETPAGPAPSIRESEHTRMNLGASDSAPLLAEPAPNAERATVTHAKPAPSIRESEHAMKLGASQSAPAHAEPAPTAEPSTVTSTKTAPSIRESEQHLIMLGAPQSAPVYAETPPTAERATVTHAKPAPSIRESEHVPMKLGASQSAPAHAKPTQTAEPTITHAKPAQTAEPTAIQAKPARTLEPTGTILGKPFEDIKLRYKLGRELGRGRSAVVYHCTEISTGKPYACKSISKNNFASENKEDIRREVKILECLRKKPNIAEFREAYEDPRSVHLVMELCTGGELLDRIIARGNYSEREAASVFRSIVKIIRTCHTMDVMHRDIKPENFLLSTKDEDSVLKAIDFGFSDFIEEGKVYRDIVGSAFYVAPEVLHRSYGKEADIWSAGVILYILLSGVPPFWGDTEKKIFDAIRGEEMDLKSSPWPSISSSAKDLIKKILMKDPKRRISLSGILGHPWVREGGEASDVPLDGVVILRIKQNRSQRFRYN